ncbi:MAG TPA: trypsin-like peptidase domain-containing protein [Candidatus Limnocylindrales bacterium]
MATATSVPGGSDLGAQTGLREALARLYPTVDTSRRIVEQAGIDSINIGFDANARTNWFKIFDEARKHDAAIDRIVGEALVEYPDNETLKRWTEGTVSPPVLEGPEPREWFGPKAAPQLEKLMGPTSSLVPISYLELGLIKARSVVKVRRADSQSGSGFLTADNVLVTNHHVLPDAATARGAVALFNYQASVSGLAVEPDERSLMPDEFFRTSPEDDWAAVRVAGSPNVAWGALDLPAPNVNVGDRVNIIQHPNGEPKQISFFSNVVVFVGGGRVQYLTDTEPGSSGSPVFDRAWNVVALHHSGGWLTEPGAKAATKEYYRNEGILIDVVKAGIAG